LEHRPTRRVLLGAGACLFGTPLHAAPSSTITTIIGPVSAATAATPSLVPNNPYGVIIGPDGALYWADFTSDRVLRLDLSSGHVRVVAGSGSKGHRGDGGSAAEAELNAPHEVRFDSKGNMYIAERDAHVIRRVDKRTGRIATIAGTGSPGFSGDGGPAEKAQLHQPHSIALDGKDNLYICDILNNRVRVREAATGLISTFAGTGEAGTFADEAPLDGTALRGPRSIDFAPDGTMFLVLREGNKIVQIDRNTRTLRRIAGTGQKGYTGDRGPALLATFDGPKGIAYAPDNSLYISDTENHVIRRLDLVRGTITTIAGTGARGEGPDGNPLACALARPHGVYVHNSTLYIGDSENNRIRALQL
jgi:DNA-binding beta-propeller fold protein YncE